MARLIGRVCFAIWLPAEMTDGQLWPLLPLQPHH